MTQPTTKPKKFHLGNLTISLKAIIITSCSVIITALIAFYLYNYSFLSPRNYAQEVAEPIEQALIKAGAVKVCSQGDYGRGVDNRRPWYEGYFEIPKDESSAIATVKQIASSNDYNLQQGSPSNKGFLGVDDKFIDKWYFNNNKSSIYGDLDSGKVELAITINSDGSENACGKTNPILLDSGHSVVSVRVNLPAFKR